MEIEKYFKHFHFCNTKVKNPPIISKYKQYENISKYNYTISEIKDILKSLNIPICKQCKKKRLVYYTINMLYITYNATKIQKCWRNYFIKQFNKTLGPAFKNHKLSNNIDDFYTAEDLNEIEYYYYFSYKDSDGFIYTFNIISLVSLIRNNCLENPYNRQKFSPELISLIEKRFKYNKILKQISEFDKYKPEPLSFQTKINNIFIKIDQLGNYTNSSWLLELNFIEMKRFLYELYEIWTFRAQLSRNRKMEICPPNGNPFMNVPRNAINFNSNVYNFQNIKNITLNVMEKLIFSANNDSDKNLGALYILSALTLVSIEARNALPWLYTSVNYIN
tara:strand:- start:10567 stop:11568 length:1002 start_codon:yes stop_codon:yes gene_type:complete